MVSELSRILSRKETEQVWVHVNACTSVTSNSLWPMDYTVDRILQTRVLEWVAFPFSRGSSNPGTEPRSPLLQADSLPAESQGKPKNAGVGSLSFLQWIFLTQESNQGLLHCRWILHQLSYQGSPENYYSKYQRYAHCSGYMPFLYSYLHFQWQIIV